MTVTLAELTQRCDAIRQRNAQPTLALRFYRTVTAPNGATIRYLDERY